MVEASTRLFILDKGEGHGCVAVDIDASLTVKLLRIVARLPICGDDITLNIVILQRRRCYLRASLLELI